MSMFDFIYMMYAPMEDHRTKMKIFRGMFTVSSFFLCSHFNYEAQQISKPPDSELDYLAVLMSLFYVLAAISIVLGLFLIKNIGLGAETKKRIMLRHVGLVLAYTVCNVYVLYCVGNREELGDD